MIALCIIGGLLLLILLLLLLRAGCRVDYSEEGFFLWITVGAIRFQLIPGKEKKKRRSPKIKKSKRTEKEEKQASKPEVDSMEGKEKSPGKLTVLLEYARPMLSAFRQLKHKPTVDHISLHYKIGGKNDPAQAAIRYGVVSAGGGALIPLINEAVEVKKWDLQPAVDFDSEDTRVALSAKVSCRIGELLYICIRFAKQLLPAYQSGKKQKKPEEEQRHGRKA